MALSALSFYRDVVVQGTLSIGANAVATESYVAGLIDPLLKSPDGYDPTGTSGYPTDYKSSGAVHEGDTFVITVAGTVGAILVDIGDLLIAKIDAPGQTAANWIVLDNNQVQATESIKGIAEIATAAETTTGTNDTNIITPLKLQGKIDALVLPSEKEYATDGTTSLSGSAATTVTHNLNSQKIQVTVLNSSLIDITAGLEIKSTGVNTITVDGNTALSNLTVLVQAIA